MNFYRPIFSSLMKESHCYATLVLRHSRSRRVKTVLIHLPSCTPVAISGWRKSYLWQSYRVLRSLRLLTYGHLQWLLLKYANDLLQEKCELTITQILTINRPFPDMWNGAMLLVALNKRHPSRPRRPDMSECCDELWQLLGRCWKDEPNERPSACDVLHDLNSWMHRVSC